MILKQALPAVICFDCGHPADQHRGKQWQSRNECVGDDECSCTRSHEAITRHAAEAVADRQAAMRRMAIALTAGLFMAFGSAFGSILASNGLAERNRDETNAVVCALISDDEGTEAGKLAAYRKDPPTTAAGQAQMREVAVALEKYQNRARRLGCPQTKE